MDKNSIKGMLVSGTQKKNPDKKWTGLAVEATVDGLLYKGIIFQPRNNDITAENAVKF